MEAAITPEEFGLVLRGWRDDKRRVRAVLEASLISFGVFGTVLDALDNGNLSISLNVAVILPAQNVSLSRQSAKGMR